METGLYIDGVHGIYAVKELCLLAQAYGYEGPAPSDDDVRDDIENADGLADDAMDWLNENVAKDGAFFGWYEGNVYYYTESEWESLT